MKNIYAVGIIVGLICPMAASADTPTAEQILHKCLAAYAAAKTYQGLETLTMQDKDEDIFLTLHVKAETGSDGNIAHGLLHITRTSTPHGDNPFHQDTIDNGTTIFIVNPDRKQYLTRPHVPDKLSGQFFSPFGGILEDARKIGAKWSVSVARSQNRPVYKLFSKPHAGEIRILIDKLNFRLYSFRAEQRQGASRSMMEITLSQQVFDQPLPETTFTWSPPADYTKIADTGKSPQNK